MAAVARGRSSSEGMRRIVARGPRGKEPAAATQLLAVSYDAATAATQKALLATRESTLGTTKVREFAFSHANLVTHILSVPTPQVDRVEAALRQTPGFKSVGLTGSRRYATGVTNAYFQNDPYFDGFSTTVAPQTGGTPPPATANVPPLYENPDVPGQWDMHAIGLEYAFGYSLFGGAYSNPNALGSAGVKIAVIDTGEDTSHPELSSKVVYQRCFITNTTTNVATSSNFTTDEDGHGTDVAGIAGEATNNGLGFTGAGGNSLIYAYRVFPTPDDNCVDPTSTDAQCGSSTPDIASAIEDAVAHHVNIISMSLGGDPCKNGQDQDAVEGAAVADAISANIVVIAASGNSFGKPVEAPACDPGVIAVGASALADGFANGSSKAGGSVSAPLEYVASYSNYGSPGATINDASAWGIVAPGGDPNGSGDSDDLHWIENIWTSTPFDVSNFGGNCAGDYPNETSIGDCRVLIAGTSMSTPHVAGAAALILAVNKTYQSPTLMKQLLCQTADDIADPNEGCGRLDVYRAMAKALSDPNLPGPFVP